MDNEINLVFLKDFFKMFMISNIPCDELKQIWKFLRHSFCISDLNIGIIEVVKVVEANDFVPTAQKVLTEMRTNKSCPTRHQDFKHMIQPFPFENFSYSLVRHKALGVRRKPLSTDASCFHRI